MLLNEEQEMIRDAMRSFAQEQLAPFAADWDRHHTFPREALSALGQLGAMGVTIPSEWGGSGLDYMSLVLMLEEIAAGDGATAAIVSIQNSLICGITYKYGTTEQKEQWLAKMASGEVLGCFCLTEPHTGSDASAITTRAERDGDYFVLNGAKQFITTGKNADVAMVFARSDKNAGKKGISCFLFPTNTPGFIVGRCEEKMGLNASDTVQISFENCRIPASCLLGELGEGYKIALSNLEGGRIGIAAQALGIARAAFELALQYAKERKTFGVPIVEHQAVNFRLVDMEIQLDSARLMIWRAAALKDAGKPCLKEASMAKTYASEAAEKIASAAIQVLGGAGYTKDYAAERIYRDVRVTQIYEGSNDIQRLVIGRSYMV